MILPCQLVQRNGHFTDGTAEVHLQSTSQRTLRATAIASVSLILGAGSIVLPVAHFVLPWLLPLIGFFIAFHMFNTRGEIKSATGPCPKCQQIVDLVGGVIETPMWRRCPSCGEPIDLKVEIPT